MQKPKYEQSVSECNKWRSLILKNCWEKHSCPLKTNLDHFGSEYGEIVNDSEISNSIDEIYDVWNKSDNENIPDKKR